MDSPKSPRRMKNCRNRLDKGNYDLCLVDILYISNERKVSFTMPSRYLVICTSRLSPIFSPLLRLFFLNR